MGAKIIQRVLPDRGTPTLPQRVFDPWEKKLLEGLEKTPDMPEFKKKAPYTVWTEEQLDTMRTMWKDGYTASDCAKVLHKGSTSVQNRIHYMVDKGELPKRRTNLPDTEREEIRQEFEQGMDGNEICRKHLISQRLFKSLAK